MNDIVQIETNNSDYKHAWQLLFDDFSYWPESNSSEEEKNKQQEQPYSYRVLI